MANVKGVGSLAGRSLMSIGDLRYEMTTEYSRDVYLPTVFGPGRILHPATYSLHLSMLRSTKTYSILHYDSHLCLS